MRRFTASTPRRTRTLTPDSCPLCPPIEEKTTWHYEDQHVVVLDCDSCNVPMVVPKWRHGEIFPIIHDAKDHILHGYMKGVVRGLFGPDVTIRTEPRDIRDHPHYHVEDA